MTTFCKGQRVAVSKYYGQALGTVRTVPAGFITVDMDDDN